METRWLYNTSETLPELCKASKETCIIPMGCVEKHGLHLPLGQDIIQASRISYMASQLETVCVFPDYIFGDISGKVPYTLSYGHVSIPIETQMLLLEQLCVQIRDNGFKKILIINGHGGNKFWLSVFMRNLSNKDYDFVVAVYNLGLPAPHAMAEILEKEGSGSIPELTKEDEELIIKHHNENLVIGHACFGETAFMMGISPESVHLDRLGIESGENLHKTDHLRRAGLTLRANGWDINHPNFFDGDDPIGCNERIGKAALRLEAENAAKAFKVFKDDNVLLDWQNEHRWR